MSRAITISYEVDWEYLQTLSDKQLGRLLEITSAAFGTLLTYQTDAYYRARAEAIRIILNNRNLFNESRGSSTNGGNASAPTSAPSAE